MFDAIAPTYELVNRVASAGRDARWRREMVQLAGLHPDDVLLDVACGTGDVVRAFAHGDASGMRPKRIVGLDFAWNMLEQARFRPAEAGFYLQGDALLLPLGSGRVTLVTCAFGIRNFQDLEAGLKEMHRVLKPGGRAVVLEFTVPRLPVFRQLYLLYVRRLMPLLARLISRDRTGAYRYLPSSVVSFHPRHEIVACFRRAGFAEVDVHPLTMSIVAIYVARRASI